MIDEKKIEEAASKHMISQLGDENYPITVREIKEQCKSDFKAGAHWAIQEFLKDLWHDASGEPKHDKQITYVWGNGIAKTIILNEEADKYNRTPSQIWHNICKNYKVVSWLYIDDLLPKEGGEK